MTKCRPRHPSLDHLCSQDSKAVYVPSEDTFFFEDILRQQSEFIRSQMQTGTVLEVGAGSGYLSAVLGDLFLCEVFCIASDINPAAAALSRTTMRRNLLPHGNSQFDVVEGNLLSCFRRLPATLFDVIVFNPPYVPSCKEELGLRDITASYAGGAKGRVVTDAFCRQLVSFLAPHGIAYLLLIRENDIVEFCESFCPTELSLQAKVVAERKTGWEHQFIVRLTRPRQASTTPTANFDKTFYPS